MGRGVIASAMALACIGCAPASASAAITVNGTCTFEEAVAAADSPGTASADCPGAAASGTTTILLGAGSFTTTGAEATSGANIAISGANAADPSVTVLHGVGNLRPLTVDAGATVTISGLTIQDGAPTPHPVHGFDGDRGTDGSAGQVGTTGGAGQPGNAGADGGAISNAGTLTVSHVAFVGDHAGPGAAGGAGGQGGGGGPVLSGHSGAGGVGGAGGTGGAGGRGGAIYSTSSLTVVHCSFFNVGAGAGGAGGIGGTGGLGGPSSTAGVIGGVGGAGGTGGTSGRGGDGGAIYSSGTAEIDDSTFQDVSSGNGGTGGTGGVGGAATGNQGSGGAGGTGGSGVVIGGNGGVLLNAGTMTLARVSIASSTAGRGGTGGNGGSGGTGTVALGGGSWGDGGDGGAGSNGGRGGDGGGIVSTGSLTITASTLQSFGGDGGYGGHGGAGASGDKTLNVNYGAGGNGGSGGGGGAGGGGFFGGPTTIVNATIADSAAGDGGNGGPGGDSKRPDGFGGFIPAGPAGNGGTGGGGVSGGAFTSTAANNAVTLQNVTIAHTSTGLHGAGGTGGTGTSGGAAGGAGSDGTVGGITHATGAPLLTNTIVAADRGANCTSANDGGHDISFGDSTCPGSTADPKLAADLTRNGGPTPTVAIGAGSAAIDAVPDPAVGSTCPDTDQRGVARPYGAQCDIGAFEKSAPPTCPNAAVGTAYETQKSFTPACADGAGATVYVRPDSQPSHGSVPDFAGFTVLTYLPDPGFVGTDTFTYHATSADGDSSVHTVTVTVGAPAPPTFTGVTPASPSEDASPHVSGTAPDGSTVRIYATPDCSGTPAATGAAATFAAPGLVVPVAHNATTTLHATMTDADGGTSGCSTSTVVYTHDDQPPDTVIDTGPSGDTSDDQPVFTFHATEPATFECSLDQGTPSFGPCSGTGTHTPALPLAAGTYTFRTRATDALGHVDASPAQVTFTVTATAPPATTTTTTTPTTTPGATTPAPGVTGPPSPAPAGAPGASGVPTQLLLPTLVTCASRRTVTIHLKRLKAKITSVTVTLTGRRSRTLRGRRLTASVSLKGLPKGTFTLTIDVRGTNGFHHRETRRYRTCVGARPRA